MLAARVGVLVVAGLLAASCVNLKYPAGASRDGGADAPAHLVTGHACASSGECQSGFCVDGFCCKTACDQECYTCAKPGNEGFCMPAPMGTADPRAMCVDMGRENCATNGLCDGSGGCEKYAAGSVCRDASCVRNQLVLASRCSADGVCISGEPQSCSPFLCDQGAKCLTQCADATECVNGSDCVNGTCCVNGNCGKRALGTACQTDDDCVSEHCSQGVCCSTSCPDGTCRSCAVKGSEGSCLPVPAGDPPFSPSTCQQNADPSMCGLDGKCDGAGACRIAVAGSTCSPASCMSATLRGAGTCDGKMHCQVPASVSCGGFLCASATACRTTCTDDTQCASPSVCGTDGACGGLSAQYFRQTNLTDLAISRTDATIDFHWFDTAPNPLLNKDNFSIRWRGKLTPRFSEPYTFYASTDDGERLWINGSLVIDRWIRKPADPEDVTMTPIPLTAGKPVDIVLEYFESGGDATAVLSWSSNPSEAKAVIPTSALSPQ